MKIQIQKNQTSIQRFCSNLFFEKGYKKVGIFIWSVFILDIVLTIFLINMFDFKDIFTYIILIFVIFYICFITILITANFCYVIFQEKLLLKLFDTDEKVKDLVYNLLSSESEQTAQKISKQFKSYIQQYIFPQTKDFVFLAINLQNYKEVLKAYISEKNKHNKQLFLDFNEENMI